MKRTVLTIFLVGFLITVTTPWMMAADSNETSLGLPTANMSVGNLVPLGIVKKVALKKAKELWGQVTPGEPIACCDQDGNIAYYMCPFHIGPGPFPSDEQIMKGVKEGRKLVKDVHEGFFSQLDLGTESGKKAQTGDATLHSSGSNVPKTIIPKPPTDYNAADYQKALKAAKGKELGIGEYGTIYVAATYDRFPIPLVSHYLPPYYLTGDLAQQKAEEVLVGTPKLNRIYFLGERGTFFEFISGNKAVTIHAYSLEVEPIKRIERRAATPEHQENIKEQWKKHAEE